MSTTQLSRAVAVCGFGATVLFSASVHAQFSGDAIKIGFITDLSGLYADLDGPAGAEAIRMAVADMGGSIAGRKVEVLVADHQNKADVAAAKAREWFDTQGLDVLIGGTNSGASLAMAKVAADKRRPFIAIGSATAALTNEQCSPYTIHYAYDTVALAKGTAPVIVKSGGKRWFFLTADYAFGAAIQRDASNVVTAAGGTIVGSVRHPLSTSDFSSFLLQAKSSGADILALANAGGDTINSVKSANEFGIGKTLKIAALLMFINDVHSLGLNVTQGMYLTDSWYWNQSPESRVWSKRFFEKFKRMPSSIQAADYSAAQFYLKAALSVASDDGEKVMGKMRESQVNDMYAKGGYVRPDGRMVHDMYLMQVKAPSQSTTPWDYYTLIATAKGDEAWTTKADSKCALWK
jgi:branched-chain amino acid transport system substrate-binding protein